MLVEHVNINWMMNVKLIKSYTPERVSKSLILTLKQYEPYCCRNIQI